MQKKVYKEGRWDLKDLLPSHKGKEFDEILKDLEKDVKKFEGYRKILKPNISAEKVIEITKLLEKISAKSNKIGTYAGLWTSMDTQNQEARSFEQKLDNYFSDLGNKTIFFGLWFKSLDEKNMNRIINGVKEYKYLFQKMKERKKYTLTELEEKIIGIKDTTGAQALLSIYSLMRNGFMFDVKGIKKKLTTEEVNALWRSDSPKLREDSYKALLNKYEENKDAFGEVYKQLVIDGYNEEIKLRGFKEAISARNISNNISDKSVETLLMTIRKNINVFHRYFKLKAKLLGTKKLNRFDIYAPVCGVSEKQYTYDECVKLVIGCYNNFSPELAKLGQQIVDDKHIDSVVVKGKRGGAYCSWVDNKTSPYILLNYTNGRRDVETLAHEMGHGIHDILTHKHPFLIMHPPLTLAETASIFGEMLVTEQLLEEETSKKNKAALIAGKIDQMWASIIRQAYFVIFEVEAHKAIPQGATVDELSKKYLNLLKEEFGKDVIVDKKFENEWLYIPHIYETPFYCYAYSFGNLITLALYQMYKEQGEKFVPKYIKFLSYGGSKKPSDICAELGINLEDEKFWQKGFDVISGMIDELEELVK